jgi:hypothetical protein
VKPSSLLNEGKFQTRRSHAKLAKDAKKIGARV